MHVIIRDELEIIEAKAVTRTLNDWQTEQEKKQVYGQLF